MTALDTPIERRTVLKGFLIAGPTLAIAWLVGSEDGAGAFPTKTAEVPVTALRTENGWVVASSGQKVSYAEVGELARTVAPQAAPHLKTSSEFKIIGRGHHREDARAIVTGTMPYALDTFPSKEALPTV